MPRRRKQREGAGDVPVAATSDIAFLLIIFFIILTTLQVTRGLMTDMPTGQKSESETLEETPTVAIHDDVVHFNDTRLETLAQLRGELEGLKLLEKASEEDRVVLLETSGSTSYDTYFKTVAIVQKAGGVLALVQSEGQEGGQ